MYILRIEVLYSTRYNVRNTSIFLVREISTKCRMFPVPRAYVVCMTLHRQSIFARESLCDWIEIGALGRRLTHHGSPYGQLIGPFPQAGTVHLTQYLAGDTNNNSKFLQALWFPSRESILCTKTYIHTRHLGLR